jgi:hypothetical protein
MTHTALVKFAPIFTLERFDDPAWTRPGRKMYYPGALQFLPGRTSVPLLADHDEDHEVGTVDKLFQMDWTDGPWICASATVPDDAASWLKRGAGASFGSKVYDRREVSIRGTTAAVIAHAFVEEVSVLIAKKPGEPRAAVLSVQRQEPPAARADRPVAGEVIYGDGTPVRRYYSNAILAVGGKPVRSRAGHAFRRVGGDYIVDQPDGSSVIYHGVDAYREALRDGAAGVR